MPLDPGASPISAIRVEPGSRLIVSRSPNTPPFNTCPKLPICSTGGLPVPIASRSTTSAISGLACGVPLDPGASPISANSARASPAAFCSSNSLVRFSIALEDKSLMFSIPLLSKKSVKSYIAGPNIPT